MYFTWRAGKEGREHAETVSSRQLQHAQNLAADARKQQRLENAYIAVLVIAEKAGQWAQTAHPMWDTHPDRELPPLPSPDDQARAEALLHAFGSTRVAAKFDAWSEIIHKMIRTSYLVEAHRVRQAPLLEGEKSPYYVFNEDLKPKERKARKEIAIEVAHELSAKPW